MFVFGWNYQKHRVCCCATSAHDFIADSKFAKLWTLTRLSKQTVKLKWDSVVRSLRGKGEKDTNLKALARVHFSFNGSGCNAEE